MIEIIATLCLLSNPVACHDEHFQLAKEQWIETAEGIPPVLVIMTEASCNLQLPNILVQELGPKTQLYRVGRAKCHEVNSNEREA